MEKFFILLLVFVAINAFSEKDIPLKMRERLDDYIELNRNVLKKWKTMTEVERKQYNEIFAYRIKHFPEVEVLRVHEIVEKLSENEQQVFSDYLKEKFPEIAENLKTHNSVIDEIDAIIRRVSTNIEFLEYIHNGLNFMYKGFPLYNPEGDEFNFPMVPQNVPDIPLKTSDLRFDDERFREMDAFILQRELWTWKWTKLTGEQQKVLENYLKKKM